MTYPITVNIEPNFDSTNTPIPDIHFSAFHTKLDKKSVFEILDKFDLNDIIKECCIITTTDLMDPKGHGCKNDCKHNVISSAKFFFNELHYGFTISFRDYGK